MFWPCQPCKNLSLKWKFNSRRRGSAPHNLQRWQRFERRKGFRVIRCMDKHDSSRDFRAHKAMSWATCHKNEGYLTCTETYRSGYFKLQLNLFYSTAQKLTITHRRVLWHNVAWREHRIYNAMMTRSAINSFFGITRQETADIRRQEEARHWAGVHWGLWWRESFGTYHRDSEAALSYVSLNKLN